MSHADADHYNAVPELLTRFSVGRILVPEAFAAGGSPTAAALLIDARRRGVVVETARAGDGFAVDERGNLYAPVQEPVLRVYAPDGAVIGDIPLPVPAANATFGGPDRRTLVITARDKAFSLPMKVRGG